MLSSLRRAVHRRAHVPATAAAATASTPPRTRRPAKLSFSLILLGTVPVLTFALGSWQVKRLAWKLDLIRSIDDRLGEPPLDASHLGSPPDDSDFEYRRLLLRGVYDYEHAVLIGPKSLESVHGFHLVVPFLSDTGQLALVNRGFVSGTSPYVDTQQGAKGTLPHPVPVHGLLRARPKKYWSVPENRPNENVWHWLDVDAICRTAGIKDANKVFIVEEIFEGDQVELKSRIGRGEPVGRERTVQLRNTHATYAFIWFSLSAVTGAMLVAAVRQRRRPGTLQLPFR